MHIYLKTVTVILVSISVLAACNNNPKQQNTIAADSLARVGNKNDTVIIFSVLNQQKLKSVDFTNKIMSNYKLHKFSDTSVNDSFTLTLYGRSVIDGGIIFNIFDSRKQVIYKDTFATFMVLAEMDEEIKKDTKVDEKIKNFFDSFFTEKFFTTPAIRYDDTANYEYDTTSSLSALTISAFVCNNIDLITDNMREKIRKDLRIYQSAI